MHQLRPRQTWEEFCNELEAEKERERKSMASWRVQMREQRRKPLNWKQAVAFWFVGTLLLIGAVMWILNGVRLPWE